jgi:hypothetical protein
VRPEFEPNDFALAKLRAEAVRTSLLHFKPYFCEFKVHKTSQNMNLEKKNLVLTWSFLPTFSPGLTTFGI